MKKEVGKTQDVGFQFGIRKTFDISAEAAWDFLFSLEGIAIWLGKLDSNLELKKEYQTQAGIKGVVRVFKPNSHIRLTWQLPEWEEASLLQIRVIPQKADKTTIALHQEKLLDAVQREAMKAYWTKIIQQIQTAIA